MLLTSAECLTHAEEKLAEADQDDRHRSRLTTAAGGWLVLAGQLRRLERTPGAPRGRPRKDAVRVHRLSPLFLSPSTGSLRETGAVHRTFPFIEENTETVARAGLCVVSDFNNLQANQGPVWFNEGFRAVSHRTEDATPNDRPA
jgi:hypothetical protein